MNTHNSAPPTSLGWIYYLHMYIREVIQSKLQPMNPASCPSSMLAAIRSVSLGHVYPTAVEALDQDSGPLLSADRARDYFTPVGSLVE